MKAIQTTTTESETSSTLEINASLETKREVGEFLVEQILRTVSQKKSPVTGEAFQALSPKYKEKKQAAGLPGVPNLEQSGGMLDDLDFEITSDGIKIGVFGEGALRADGHNNLSGDSMLPTRQFLPGEGEGFTASIEREIERIVADAAGSVVDVSDAELSDIGSPSELYAVLLPVFGVTSRSEARLAVLRSPKWYNVLSARGLLEWL